MVVFHERIIPLARIGYEIIIANLALRALLAIIHRLNQMILPPSDEFVGLMVVMCTEQWQMWSWNPASNTYSGHPTVLQRPVPHDAANTLVHTQLLS